MKTIKLNKAMAICHDGLTPTDYAEGDEVPCEDDLAASLIRGGDGEEIPAPKLSEKIEPTAPAADAAPKKPGKPRSSKKSKGAAPENKDAGAPAEDKGA